MGKRDPDPAYRRSGLVIRCGRCHKRAGDVYRLEDATDDRVLLIPTALRGIAADGGYARREYVSASGTDHPVRFECPRHHWLTVTASELVARARAVWLAGGSATWVVDPA
jgi:hypothetical protein